MVALSVKQLVRRHGAFVSAVTGASLALAIIVQRVAMDFVGVVIVAYPGDAFGISLGSAVLTAIPFGIGFFLSLWLVAQIAGELRVGHVITRSILAAGIGTSILFIVLAILGVIGAFSFDGALFANSLPSVFSPTGAAGALARALYSALQSFVSLLPLGLLAGLLLWGWRKDHPPRQPLAGIIDV